jgi:hypothetical protein
MHWIQKNVWTPFYMLYLGVRIYFASLGYYIGATNVVGSPVLTNGVGLLLKLTQLGLK